jgi:hypothetical protein
MLLEELCSNIAQELHIFRRWKQDPTFLHLKDNSKNLLESSKNEQCIFWQLSNARLGSFNSMKIFLNAMLSLYLAIYCSLLHITKRRCVLIVMLKALNPFIGIVYRIMHMFGKNTTATKTDVL